MHSRMRRPRNRPLCTLMLASVMALGASLNPASGMTSVDAQIAAMSLSQKLGQLLMVGFRGTVYQDSESLQQAVEQAQVGGVILFDRDGERGQYGRNIRGAEQLAQLTRTMQAHSAVPLWIAIDEEGGRVSRLHPRHGFSRKLSAQALGQQSVQATAEQAQRIAQELQQVGVNMNFAPVVDVASNPNNPVIVQLQRSFGSDPLAVTAHARRAVQVYREHGVVAVLKHFPGHGSSQGDSHHEFVDVSKSWSESELLPYQIMIDAGEAEAIMSAHLVHQRWDSEHPATLSRTLIQGLLRDELRFDGLVVSDDLEMAAISKRYPLQEAMERAIDAGVDVLLIANNGVFDPNIALRARGLLEASVQAGRLSEAQVDAAVRRNLLLKHRFGLL